VLGHGHVSRTIPTASPGYSLRQRALSSGARALSDIELLALLLSRFARGEPELAPAAALLDAAGGLVGVARASARQLASRHRLGISRAAHLAAAFEVGHRASVRRLLDERKFVGSFDSVAAWGRARIAALEHEEVWLLALDGQNRLVSATRIAQGGLHGCALTPRDVLSPALRDGASAIVLVHNHPSGDPTPSHEDIHMTRAVAVAADVLAIPLLDHVVVARGGACSLLELGALRSGV
jgi:DNA repair protein RadC